MYEFLETFVVVVAVGLVYMLPAVIARNHRQFNGILVLNVLLGWTFLGWIGALVWAVSGGEDG